MQDKKLEPLLEDDLRCKFEPQGEFYSKREAANNEL